MKLEAILYGSDPEVTKTEPLDWSSNYKNYFTKSGNVYTAVSDVSAPSWEADKYYTAGTEARLPLPDEIATIFAEG